MPIARSAAVGPVGSGPRRATTIARPVNPKMAASTVACSPVNIRNVSMRGRYHAGMKAVGLHKYLPIDHPESLLDLEVEAPAAAGRDLQIEVKAISVNPVDTKRRAPKDAIEKTPKIL